MSQSNKEMLLWARKPSLLNDVQALFQQAQKQNFSCRLQLSVYLISQITK